MQSSSRSSAPGGTRRLAAATVVRRRDFTDDLFVLWLRPDVPFTFAPGQYVTIGARGIERPYSIVSAPYERHLELFVEYVPPERGGRLTPLLYAGQVCDGLTMRPTPKGRFTLRRGIRNHVMVATVTGIAPYVSMVRQFLHDRAIGAGSMEPCRFFVMQGASHQDEFVYDAEFRRLSRHHPDVVQFVSSVSRPWAPRNAGWTGPVGRIHLLLDEHLQRWGLRPDETVVYLCGHPGMIDAATAQLQPQSWTIAAERYWLLRP